MDREALEIHVIQLRSEISNLRNHIDRYRLIVAGFRGAIKGMEAALYPPMPGESGPRQNWPDVDALVESAAK
jgi:hypothetical protein